MTTTTTRTRLSSIIFLAIFLFLARTANSQELRIHNASEFVQFSDGVNSGGNYSGTTVFLDSDIDLSGVSMGPIGNYTYYFNGVFDGQGHTISNLAISSSDSNFVGLFGKSGGSTFKDVVFDESCSFTSLYNTNFFSPVYIGSILGYHDGQFGSCNIEGIVNMGNVTFNGTVQHNLIVGGIVGYLTSQNSALTIKNCVNYGVVKNMGYFDSHANAYLGGIVGHCYGGSSSVTFHILNCANYGVVVNISTSVSLDGYLGGIVGKTENYVHIENCMTSGLLYSPKKNGKIGSFIGYACDPLDTQIAHSFWSKDVAEHNMTGGTQPEKTVPVTDTSLTEMNTATLDDLNSYVAGNPDKGMSRWIALHMNGGSINGIDHETLIVTQRKFPVPVKEGNAFLFWCTDEALTQMYNSSAASVDGNTSDLYSVWSINTVTFSFENETITTKNVTYGGVYGPLPKMTEKEGHSIIWSTEEGGIENEITSESIVRIAKDHTLYGRFIPNNYTATFSYGNGMLVPTSVTYGQPYKTFPKVAEKEGHTFKWYTTEEGGQGDEITSESIVRIAKDHTLYGLFIPNNYTATFSYGNGTTTTLTVTFNEAITYPADPKKEGFSFDGWEPSGITNMPARDVTFTAKWVEVTEYVEIVFGKKDLSEQEVKAIIEKYVGGSEYEMKIVAVGDDSTTVIIRFVDADKAESFVESINVGSDSGKIKSTGYTSQTLFSLSFDAIPSFILPFVL